MIDDDDDCEAVGGIRIDMRNGSSTERICPNATVHHKSHIT
jgi:hypothetical protein